MNLASPAVGFLTWPPSPPLPRLARSPPQDPVNVHNHAQNLRDRHHHHHNMADPYRRQDYDDRQLFKSPDAELIVVLDSQTTNYRRDTTTIQQQQPIQALPKFSTSRIMTRRTVMNSNRLLNDRQAASSSSEMINVNAILDADSSNAQFEHEPQYDGRGSYDSYLYDFNSPFDTQSSQVPNIFQPSSSSTTPSDDICTEFAELDAFMNCDITSLDAYVHDETITTSYNQQTDFPAAPSTSTLSPQNLSSPELDVEPLDEFFPQLAHQNKADKSRARKPSYASSTTTSSDYSDYRVKRDKNNASSQKSRAKRQVMVNLKKDEKEQLEKRNVELKTMLMTLEEQVEDYKRMVMMFVNKR